GSEGCAAQRNCFGAARCRSPVRTYLVVGRGPSRRRRQHIVGAMGRTREPFAKIGDRVATPRRSPACTRRLSGTRGSIPASTDGASEGRPTETAHGGRNSAAGGSGGR